MTKRVALISEHASPLAAIGGVDSGGQNIYVGELAQHLAGRGYQVDIFTRRDNDLLPAQVPYKGAVRVINVPAGPPRFVRKEDLLPYMEEFSDYMVKFCRREGGYDIIHANFWMSGLVAMDISSVLGIPFVITFHALGRVRRLYQGDADQFPEVRFEIEDRIARRASAIIAECPQDRDDLVNLYHADPSRITIIPCGFDPHELWPVNKTHARKAIGVNSDGRVILQLGRLVPRKGVETAVRGFARFIKDYHKDAKLVIVGGETRKPDPVATPEIGRLQKISREEGVAQNVIFKGRANREELRFYYGAADVFVTTPWYEPFGITPLESMACGTPVIGSRVGGLKFSVKDGETGYLIPANESAALANRIAYLFQYPYLINYFRHKAITRVHSLFTWETVSARVARLYEQIVGRPADMLEQGLSDLWGTIRSLREPAVIGQRNDMPYPYTKEHE